MMIKKNILRFLRNRDILPYAEYAHYLMDRMRYCYENKRLLAKQNRYLLPPPRAMHDAYRSTSLRLYYEGAILTAEAIAMLIKKHQPCSSTILEWGCGSARIIQHMPSFFPQETSFTGSDYNEECIEWCKDKFRPIEFIKNNLSPPILYRDGNFDSIYAISVITHLSLKQQKAWISELKRLLKSRGILIITTHGERAAKKLLPDEYSELQINGVLIKGNTKEGSRCFISYHTENYLRENLFKEFVILEHIDNHNFVHQDIWVLSPLQNSS